MVQIKPASPNIPDDVLKRAYTLGQWVVNTKCLRKKVVIPGLGGVYILDAINYNAAGICKVIILDTTSGGVILHPRSGTLEDLEYTEYIVDAILGTYSVTHTTKGVKGGWKSGQEVLDTAYIFPLVDSDNASFVETEDESAFAGDSGNYGNIYWTNGITDEKLIDDLVVLSWKGTPTRHFALSSLIQIQGLSKLETTIPSTNEDIPQYTAFGYNLYQNGNIYAQAPRYSWPNNTSDNADGRCLILGACLNSTDGKIYIVTWSDHYNANTTITFDDGTKRTPENGGFWLTLWKEGNQRDGWTFVSEHVYSRNNLPWFANSEGTTFVCSNGDTLTISGTLTYKSLEYGEYKEEIPQVNNSPATCLLTIDATFNGNEYYEYNKELKLYCPVSLSFNSKSSYSTVDDKIKVFEGSFTEVISPWNETGSLAIYGTTTPSVNTQYTATGGTKFDSVEYPQYPTGYKWSGSVNESGFLTISGKCGMGSVTVEDACGTSVSLTLQFPIGTWYTVSWWRNRASCYTNGACQQLPLPVNTTLSVGGKTENYISGATTQYTTYGGFQCWDTINNVCAYQTVPTGLLPDTANYDETFVYGTVNTSQYTPGNYCPKHCHDISATPTTYNTYRCVCERKVYEWGCSGKVCVNGPVTQPACGSTNTYSWVMP